MDELAKEFATSEVTIRKDLAALEPAALLLRRYGGAIPFPEELSDLSQNKQKFRFESKAIAKAAAALIRDHNRIIIDFGTTTAALIPQPQSKRGLVVMTNSLQWPTPCVSWITAHPADEWRRGTTTLSPFRANRRAGHSLLRFRPAFYRL